MINKKKLLILIIAVSTIISANSVFGLSNWLDDYSVTGLSNIGLYSIDYFNITGGDFYIDCRITASERWNSEGNAQIKIIPAIKSGSSWSQISTKAAYLTKAAWDDTYTIKSFTGLTNGTYKYFLKSDYSDRLNTNGTVYDTN